MHFSYIFLKSLKSTGKGAIILPHGVLFRGNVEAEIRKNIINRGYIKGIIGMPANFFMVQVSLLRLLLWTKKMPMQELVFL